MIFKRIALSICFVLICGFSQAQVGINTPTPLSMLDINGNLSIKALGISPTLNGGPSGIATPIDDGVYISLSPLAGSVEFIVPNAALVPGRIYILRNISNSITAELYSFGGQFFAKDSNTASSSPLYLPSNAILKTIILVSDGQNWTYFF